MSFTCDICGKGRSVGMKISHSHIRTKKVWKPNLQPVKANVNGQTVRLRVCTRCLRSGKVQRASNVSAPSNVSA
ncbi:MAG: 50S ribosomal protein L28 [Clostridiales bacterium]|nr:50S ribosomal protein L28 [Clostridiales bacterium]